MSTVPCFAWNLRVLLCLVWPRINPLAPSLSSNLFLLGPVCLSVLLGVSESVFRVACLAQEVKNSGLIYFFTSELERFYNS